MAQVVAMADDVGDKLAASHFGVTERTVQRYRSIAKSGQNVALSEALENKKAELNAVRGDWTVEAVATMTTLVRKVGELAEKATLSNLRDLVGAIKILGELDIQAAVMKGPDINDEHAGLDGEGAEASEAAGRGGSGAGRPAASIN
jgi:hypothetical protein